LIQDFAAEKTECPEIDSKKSKGRNATGGAIPWAYGDTH
jgi:hypothetical protein